MMKDGKAKVQVLILLVCMYVLLSGCETMEQTITEPQKAENTIVQQKLTEESSAGLILRKVYNETLVYEDGSDLAYIHMTYPKIENTEQDKGIDMINEFYRLQFDQFITSSLSYAKTATIEEKEFSIQQGYSFNPYAYSQSFTIPYNENNIISILRTGYEYTGGAHPNGYWVSETFDVKKGKKITLEEILGVSKEEALEKVYKTVLSQIEKTKGTDDFAFYETYEQDIRTYYSEEDFVLTQNGIMFYFQQYAIAPYVAGIPTFELSFEEMGHSAMPIASVQKSIDENMLYERAEQLIERNKDVFYNIFGLSMLEMDRSQEHSSEETIFPIKNTRFENYQYFSEYIRSIYVKNEAEQLLGNGRYINKDGKLFGDFSKDAGAGYYTDWDRYEYMIKDIKDHTALVVIYTKDSSPAGEEERIIEVKMSKQGNEWLLEKMIY